MLGEYAVYILYMLPKGACSVGIPLIFKSAVLAANNELLVTCGYSQIWRASDYLPRPLETDVYE